MSASGGNSLQARVERALAAKHLSTSVGVHVKTSGAVVKLYGTVANGVIIDQAKYVASVVPGVAEVDNQLKSSRH
ncbi:MAG: BON domain-containing protein [Sinobacteraceae bacterium]|nr:BON domain-containing protein [Nevskiaceae bacterium]